MVLPTLTVEARTSALRRAIAVRQERAELLADIKDGKVSLHDVLRRDDAVVARTPVRRVLEALPRIGKVRAGQILDELGISETRRVQGLGVRQRERLLHLFPSQG
ncbi:integration host factor, actinobacterial type [Streptomyces atroolivaceus]|uniref:Integration host factor, actinobacterial type n=1 Tax=Streptomyces atroolivaceus TaxID=66869 RepID=A0ABV9VKQ5_STRAZ|nr:integration host factor, actinobacterial type [Streptomyces atroolivaceus]